MSFGVKKRSDLTTATPKPVLNDVINLNDKQIQIKINTQSVKICKKLLFTHFLMWNCFLFYESLCMIKHKKMAASVAVPGS